MRRLIRQLVRVQTVAVLVIAWLAGALGLGLATGAGAVATVALMALGPVLGCLLLLIRHSLDLAGRIGNLAAESVVAAVKCVPQAPAGGQQAHGHQAWWVRPSLSAALASTRRRRRQAHASIVSCVTRG